MSKSQESYQSWSDRQLLEEHAAHPERFVRVGGETPKIVKIRSMKRSRGPIAKVRANSAVKTANIRRLRGIVRTMKQEIATLTKLKIRPGDNPPDLLSEVAKITQKYSQPKTQP